MSVRSLAAGLCTGLAAGLPSRLALGGATAAATAATAAAVLAMVAADDRPALAQGATQGTPQRWEVQVSAADPSKNLILQGYAPNPLAIRVGDTVTWRWSPDNPAPHTVTFTSGKPAPADIMPGPNPGELMLGPGTFPIGPAAAPGGAIPYDGTELVNSGIPNEPNATFSLTFTKTGTFGYLCLLHPGMRGEIEVREAGASLPETPAQAQARGQATIAAVLGRIQTGAAAVQSVNRDGVHTAMAGLGDGFGASAIQFLPADLTVRRGDTVVWAMPDPYEIHTISFTSGGTPPDFVEPRPQPSGPPMLVIPSTVAGPVGGATYTGQGLVSSGIVGNGGAYVLKFDAPAGTYEYLCLIHPTMRGRVTVTE
jgi:plastocyanin